MMMFKLIEKQVLRHVIFRDDFISITHRQIANFLKPHSISFKFGIMAMLAGLIGVPTGSYLAQRLRPIDSQCDPLICAYGLIISAPCVYLGLVCAPFSTTWCFIFVFFAQLFLNMCWSIIADIVLVR